MLRVASLTKGSPASRQSGSSEGTKGHGVVQHSSLGLATRS
eukprot:CAMPEP_0172653354 /NCGR_PEP_ID=MMETSP1068-20121228/243785_1 /TAXON_ID=35684 /ORGANISM="Pseudopedinella elastica, Strain CCMP716" /LENGTH=40 /DNA_ID= /DNA_START= /DNA_END= /DNA_ORIENTATION=